MQKLLILLSFLALVACSKNDNYPGTLHKRNFFKNGDQAFELVKKQVARFHAEEKLETIERISYLYAESRTYAFVFYKSNRGHRSIVVIKDYVAEQEIAGSVITCEGESCDCKVKAIIRSDGHADISCSCTSCTMLTNNGLE
jgi:2,3-bisphosphoglycerate-independent phosphoglycerate mutase